MAKTRWAGVPAARKSARLASRSTARSTATAGPEALLPSSRCSPPPPPCGESPMPSSPGPSSPSSPVAVPLPSLPSVSPPPSPAHCQSSPLNYVPRPAFLLPIPKPILPSPVHAGCFFCASPSYFVFSHTSSPSIPTNESVLSLNLPLPT